MFDPTHPDNLDEFNNQFTQLSDKFLFVNQIIDSWNEIQNDLTSPSGAPVLKFSLSNHSKNFQSLNGKTFEFSLDCFNPYVNSVRSINGAFLCVGFAFLLFKRIPDVLNGVGMITEHNSAPSQGRRFNSDVNQKQSFKSSKE